MPKGDKNGQFTVRIDEADYKRLVKEAVKNDRPLISQLRIIFRERYGATA